mgnify:CR=1 FL=1
MAEIKPMALIESMRKKVCMHSDVYFRTNKKTGKVYTGTDRRESTFRESRRCSTDYPRRSDGESEIAGRVQIPNQDRFAFRLCDA